MGKHCSSAQRELFEEPPQGINLGSGERRKLVEQLQVLLTEAMNDLSVRQETDDDQDHV